MKTPTNREARYEQSNPAPAERSPSLQAATACLSSSQALPLAASAPPGCPPPRLRVPDRQQSLSTLIIDDLLDAGHPARAVWAYVCELDLSPLYDRIRSRDGLPGRPAIDPRLLVALWLYATLSGFISARELADLCVNHNAFRWLAGGIHVNYHSLADFRSLEPEFLQRLLNESVERLRQQGLVDLDRVAQDGIRVRASAGAASFRRRETLEKLLQEALVEVERLQQQTAKTADPIVNQEVTTRSQSADEPPASAQEKAAKLRHAEDHLERVDQALERLPELEAKIKPGEDKQARASTTDAQATVMKMADGGFRPAYNIQYSTACEGQVIVGVDVVTVSSDQGQMVPMIEQIEEHFGQSPKEELVDGGFVNKQEIEQVQSEKDCKVYAPVPKPKREEVDRYQAKGTDSVEVAEWRTRMGTEEAKEIYKQRAATAECVNAQARNRGLEQFLVRGVEKVKAIALWFAIAHNMKRSFSLQGQPAVASGP